MGLVSFSQQVLDILTIIVDKYIIFIIYLLYVDYFLYNKYSKANFCGHCGNSYYYIARVENRLKLIFYLGRLSYSLHSICHATMNLRVGWTDSLLYYTKTNLRLILIWFIWDWDRNSDNILFGLMPLNSMPLA